MTKKAEILVADDDPLLLELLVDTLTTIGHQATGVEDGLQALQQLEKAHYDLVISDVKMPNMDGLQLLGEIRKRYPAMPVLFISAYLSQDMLVSINPDGFLAKPFRISHVEELISETLKKKRVAPAPSKSRYGLVVSTDRQLQTQILRASENMDVELLQVASMKEATALLYSQRISVLISDDSLVQTDQAEVLAPVRRLSPKLPILVFTQNVHVSNALHEVGILTVDAPFTNEKVVEAISSALAISVPLS